MAEQTATPPSAPPPSAPPTFDQTVAASAAGRPPLWRRFVRGPEGDPAWVRPVLLAVLVGAAGLYLWDLGASHWANEFYSAAAQSGAKSWKAFFFASSDWGNSITVDKPPAALWIMALSVRVFGLSSWSILVPQALEGVAAVGLLYATVRRWSGPVAGLVAAAGFALTPVVVLMFRYNNPDALLTLLLIGAAYCVVRAVDAAGNRAGTGWLALAGVLLGLGFLTKTLQAFLVLPALALVYLLVAPVGFWRRCGKLLLAGLALVMTAGWWVLATIVWPADQRPYIGGSTDNSVLQLAFGYNGLGRIFAGGDGSGNGPGPADTGLGRMFNDDVGTQVAWLLPAALLALVAGLWLTRRAPRTDRVRAALVLWGGWLLVTAGIFSTMKGIFHSYYTIALAPSVAALLAVGGRELWVRRSAWAARWTLAALVGLTAATAWNFLSRVPHWNPWLRWVILGLAVAALVVVVRRFVVVGALAGLVLALTAPAAFALSTVGSAHNGGIVSAGPSAVATSIVPSLSSPGVIVESGAPGQGSNPVGGTGPQQGPVSAAGPPVTKGTPQPERGPVRIIGGPPAPSKALIALLKATTTTWAAAAIDVQPSILQLETGKAIIPVGGFTGSDPAPTLAQFKKWVSQGRISYLVLGNQQDASASSGGPVVIHPGGADAQPTSPAIVTWVKQHFTARTVGGVSVYDLR